MLKSRETRRAPHGRLRWAGGLAGETGGSAGWVMLGELTDNPDDGAAGGGHADTAVEVQKQQRAVPGLKLMTAEASMLPMQASDAVAPLQKSKHWSSIRGVVRWSITAVSCGASFVCALNDQMRFGWLQFERTVRCRPL